MADFDINNVDWSTFGFGYVKTNCNFRTEFKDGAWGELQSYESDILEMHISSPSLHYGAQAFEGLKAFRGVDGKVRIFRPYDNARRMISSAQRMCMAEPSEDLFVEACVAAVRANIDYVPPYESGATLYIRPMLIGTGAVLGVRPSKEYMFAVFVSPVGAYFKGMISVIVNVDYDRAAPRGTGATKCGGNYGASIYPGEVAHEQGYANVLYLDPMEHKYVEECGAANFFGIKDGKYITPASPSILPSITNMSLRQLAADMGLEVEQRPVPFEEMATFDECGACGTAAVISPVGSIYDPRTGETINYGDSEGPYCKAMYEKLQDIQYGRAEDKYNWCVIVE